MEMFVNRQGLGFPLLLLSPARTLSIMLSCIGKPPQHRLIIKRLRDDQDRLSMTITQPGDPSRWRVQNGFGLGHAVVENTDIDVNVDGKRDYSLSGELSVSTKRLSC